MNIMTCIVLIFSILNLHGSNYEYRQAKPEDVPSLLHLINTCAVKDSAKIVVLPKKFRQTSLEDAIKKGRIFVALAKDTEQEHKHSGLTQKSSPHDAAARVVAYKKLFVIKNATEKKEILANELRCTDPKKCSFAGTVTHDGRCTQVRAPSVKNMFSCCIYNGADFTHPDHRGNGINQQLTACALDTIKSDLESGDSPYITFLYGMVKENAGTKPGDKTDRSVSLAKAFAVFLASLYNTKPTAIEFLHLRYPAFMPTFDPESQEPRPLPDEKSVPGYGCILTYKCKEQQ